MLDARDDDYLNANSLFRVSKLSDDLYLSGACALKGGTLENLGVTCVINCTTRQELPDTPTAKCVTKYVRIPVLDSTSTNLSQYFDKVADIINQVSKSGGKTLVHCVAGVSRSASICLAYLVKYGRMSLRDAFYFVRGKRPCVRPNAGFFKQLVTFEISLRARATVLIIYDPTTRSYIPDVYQFERKKIHSNNNNNNFTLKRPSQFVR